METSFLIICFKFCTQCLGRKPGEKGLTSGVTEYLHVNTKTCHISRMLQQKPRSSSAGETPTEKSPAHMGRLLQREMVAEAPMAMTAGQSWVPGHLHPVTTPVVTGVRLTECAGLRSWMFPQIKHWGTGGAWPRPGVTS